MIVSPATVRSIKDMEIAATDKYLSRLEREANWAKQELEATLEAISEGRRDAMLLIGAGFEVETSQWSPLQTLEVFLGDATLGKKGRKERKEAVLAVQEKKAEVCRLFQCHLEDHSRELIDGKRGTVKVTWKLSKAPHVHVWSIEHLPSSKDEGKCKVVKRVVRQSPRVIEYSLECSV